MFFNELVKRIQFLQIINQSMLFHFYIKSSICYSARVIRSARFIMYAWLGCDATIILSSNISFWIRKCVFISCKSSSWLSGKIGIAVYIYRNLCSFYFIKEKTLPIFSAISTSSMWKKRLTFRLFIRRRLLCSSLKHLAARLYSSLFIRCNVIISSSTFRISWLPSRRTHTWLTEISQTLPQLFF